MKNTCLFEFHGTLVGPWPPRWTVRENTEAEVSDALASVTDPIERQAALQACQIRTQGAFA